jgi:death-on-curing protein
MKYLTLLQVLELYREIISQSGGTFGIRNIALLESALAQPRATFEGKDLYATVSEKASALAFSLSKNHPFLDGNKRISHAAMAVFLLLNGYDIDSSVDEQERVFLDLANGQVTRDELTVWLNQNIVPKSK